jgi:RHS repeat-associated protein
MKKPIIRILSLVLILTHLFTICLRDVSFAAQSSSSSSVATTTNSGASTTKSASTSTQSPTKPAAGSTKTKDTASSTKSMSLAAASSSSSPQMSVSFNTSVLKSFQSDPFTGRAMFSVPINVPVGRKGVQPNIALTYASGSGNGILGVGWSLELGSIQRSTKRGVPKYDSTDTFIFNSQGSNQELVNIGGNEYRPKTEGSFSKFVFDGTSWVITDKGGTKYYFGQTENARQINSKGIFSWNLNKVVDLQTNFIEIEYFVDQGQIYPSKIKYTGNQSQNLEPLCEVDFIFTDRPDYFLSYRSQAKVVIAKRLTEIKSKFRNNLINQYKIEYLEGQSARPLSLIKQITLFDASSSNSYPPVVFTYQQLNPSFTDVQQLPINRRSDDPLRNSEEYSFFRYQSDNRVFSTMLDINADGLIDWIQRKNTSPYTSYSVLLNNGLGFNAPIEWGPLLGDFVDGAIDWSNNGLYRDLGVIDINADGLPDRVYYTAGNSKYKVQLNSGYGFANIFTDFGTLRGGGEYYDCITGSSLSPYGIRSDTMDINGDGFADKVMAAKNGSPYNSMDVQLNDGTSFGLIQKWPVAWDDTRNTSEQWNFLRTPDANTTMITMLDMNGDGLPDRVMRKYDAPYAGFDVQLNNGSGFDKPVIWGPLLYNNGPEASSPEWSDSGLYKRLALIDMNADGLPDRVHYEDNDNKYEVQLNNGHGFEATYVYWTNIGSIGQAFDCITGYSLSPYGMRADVFDINGDGLPDKVTNKITGAPYDYVEARLNNNSMPAGYLKEISNGIGGTIAVTYKPYKGKDNSSYDPQKLLPFCVWVVDSITQNSGFSQPINTQNFKYDSGFFDFKDREFRGFGYVKTTDSEGTSSESYFKQDSIFKARPYKQEVKDKDNKLYSKTENTWQSIELYPGVNFPYLSQADNYVYDPDSIDNYKQTRVKYEYDSYGNPKKVISEGEVAVTGDEKTQVTEYVYNTTDWILSCPKSTILLDKNQTKVSEKRFYYDNHTTLDEIPAKGMLTKEESYLKDPIKNTQKYISSSYAYDSYGNLVSSTDALGRITTTIYDSVQFSYPIQTTNALGKSVQTVYYGINEGVGDAIIGLGLPGQVKFTQDYNAQKNYNIYDSLGRITKAIGPLDTEGYPGAIYEYDLSAQPIKVVRKVKGDYSAQPEYLTSYSFYDGLGRVIEEKTPSENNPLNNQPRQIISGLVRYDSRGQIKEKYLPYFVDASANYESPVYNTPHSSFVYDALGRLTQSINPDLTSSSVSYGIWSKTTTDENNHSKDYYFDAYGKITKVEEHNSGQVYTTKYEYDTLGNLIKLTDNQNNITQIWYDSLGRKIKMDDPDMGIWLYEYDALGNLIKQTDAKGQVLRFTYDVLNRLLRKTNYTNAASPITLVTYTYDSAAKSYCIGRLSKVTDLSGSTDFYYDKLGRETKSIKTITGSGAYTVERTYDALDRLLTLKYPDSTLITYSYNPQGIEKVSSLRAPEGGEAISYVSNIDYSPTGQLTKVQYGNGTQTNYAYEPNTLRLNNIVTQSPSGKIQDLSYQFDNTGNIRNIVDAVNTATQSFVYDDLNRLISASGSYGALSYSYDSIGNMINKEGVNLTYGKNGKLPHAVTQYGNDLSIDYDANGNMITKGDLSLTYDVESRLKEAQRAPPQPVTISITLKPGWNFFSLPVIPQDTKVSSVLAQISGKYSQISRYSPNTKTFEHNVANTKFDQFTDFEYGKGYQIYITSTSDVNLDIIGTLPLTTQNIGLVTGENLIFCPKTTETTVEAALLPLKLNTDYSKVVYYNKFLNKFEEYSSIKQEFTTLKPGTSYYIICLKDATLTVSGSQQPPVSFTYDGDGGRVSKSLIADGILQSKTTYIGSLYEINSDGTTTKHIFSGSNRVATVTANTVIPAQAGIQYYHSDHLGSSNVITDATGAQIGFTEFTPYGSTFKQTGSFDPKHKFTGKELDSSTGLYYYGARYYDPFFGRFITPDTIVQAPYDPQSLNRYSYCRNNPINLVDPTGHSWKSFWKKFGGAIASIAVGIVVGIATAGIGSVFYSTTMGMGAFWGGVASAATTGVLAGAAAGGVGGAFYGQNIGQSMLMGAAFGALSGAVFGGMISKVGGLDWNWKVGFERVGLSAVVGGGISEMAGGSFKDGAIFAGAIAGADFVYRVMVSTALKGRNVGASMRTAEQNGQPKVFRNEDGSVREVTLNERRLNNVGFASEEIASGLKHFVGDETGPVMSAIGRFIPGMQGMSLSHDVAVRALCSTFGSTTNFVVFNFQTMPILYGLNAAGSLINDSPGMIGYYEASRDHM